MEKKNIWNNDLEDIINGFTTNNIGFQCAFCHALYESGRVYEFEGELFDAYGAIREHIKKEHGSVVDYLLAQNPALLGITEIQGQILELVSKSKKDKEIAEIVGIAQSTVRNHRFKLREKEKQSKLFLALMTSLEHRVNQSISVTDKGEIKELHNSATMIDERYNITEKDIKNTLKAYLDENNAITQFPAKEKRKIILLREVMKNFKKNVEYDEKEVNRILKRIYPDFSTIRRYLIEYGFMDRSKDCKVYRANL